MKNIKKIKSPLIQSVMFRIFTILLFLFTVLLYGIIVGLFYLRYSNSIDIIYTTEATHTLIGIVILIFILGWFFSYTLYLSLIHI